MVPPAQSEAIRDALAARGIPHAYVVYDGEGHGFRRAENVIHALETELAFLGAVFGFETPGVAPLTLALSGSPIRAPVRRRRERARRRGARIRGRAARCRPLRASATR